MDESRGEAIYSVSWRLRRVTIEYAYVSVPVVDDMVKPDKEGVNRIDVEAMQRRAIATGRGPDVAWYPEEQGIEVHPLQKAPEPNERRFPC
jgi:hypothetical protein